MDRLRTVTLSPGGRPIVRVNLADPTGLTVYTERASFQVAPSSPTQAMSRSTRRYGGSVQGGETADNWTVTAKWWVKGGGVADTVLANLETLMAEVDDLQTQGPEYPKLMEWRPDGASQSTFFEIRGSGTFTPTYDWAAFAGAAMICASMTWPVAPLGRGAPMDIRDPFDVDSRTDYAFDQNSCVYVPASVAQGTDGALGVSATKSVTARHVDRGYETTDCQVMVGFRMATGLPSEVGAVINATSANDGLMARLDDSTFALVQRQAGTDTVLKSSPTTASPPLAANATVWVAIRREGIVVTCSYWANRPPTPQVPPDQSITYLFTPGTVLQAGYAGFEIDAWPVDGVLDYFEATPYTYGAHVLGAANGTAQGFVYPSGGLPTISHFTPGLVDLPGVPGTAEAAMDVQIDLNAISLVPATVGPTVAAQAGGGVWGKATTAGYVYTKVTSAGESLPSPVTTVALTATQSAQITLYIDSDAQSVNVYRVSNTGTPASVGLIQTVQITQFEMLARGLSFADSGAAPSVSGATPPTTGGAFPISPEWALLSWARKPLNYNRCWNGDFEVDLDGWAAANNSALVRSSAQPKFGQSHGLATLGTAGPYGIMFNSYHRYRAGVTYTASAWLASTDGTPPTVSLEMIARITGQNGNSLIVGTTSSAATALTAAYQQVQVQFVTQLDCDQVILNVAGATGTSGKHVLIDGVEIYEGIVPPALASQAQGRGAPPPLGVLDGLDSKPTDALLTACTMFTNGSGAVNPTRASYYIAPSTQTAGAATLFWWIDPHLIATPDDFSRGTVSIEVFWKGQVPPALPNASGENYLIAPNLTISAVPDPVLAANAAERFTQEFGSAGTDILQYPGSVASAGGSFNGPTLTRGGTLVLPVNPAAPIRWKLKAAHTWAGGIPTNGGAATFCCESLYLACGQRRACNPTGKDQGDGTYPAFSAAPASVALRKTIRSDLRGRAATLYGAGALPSPPYSDADDSGLTGSQIILQPATPGNPTQDHSLMCALSWPVPDADGGTQGYKFPSNMYPVVLHAAVTPRYRLARAGS